MKSKILLMGLAAVTAILVWAMVTANHRSTGVAASNPKLAESVPATEAPPKNLPVAAPAQPVPAAKIAVTTQSVIPVEAALADEPLKINGYVVQDPEARLALSFVGTDPAAEAYWSQAINDPNLPSEERKDLIEDLNEDGLMDPKNPTAEDLPVIANRIQLQLEQMAPQAMDGVNAAAFAEAYK